MILIIVGIGLYAGILLFILSFCKISARADRDMRIIHNGELLYSNFVGQNLLKLTIENKNSELLPVPDSSLRKLTRSPLVEAKVRFKLPTHSSDVATRNP